MNAGCENGLQSRSINNNCSSEREEFNNGFIPSSYPHEASASERARLTVYQKFMAFCNCKSKDESSQNSPEQVEHNVLLRGLVAAFSRRPCIILCVTIVTSFLITWKGLSDYGVPEFDDPYLGFETRSTSISNRIITLRNLKSEVNQLRTLENYPGEKLSGREWRRRKREKDSVSVLGIQDAKENDFDFNGHDRCSTNPLEDYSRVALELKDPRSIFEYETVMLICFYQKKVEELYSYSMLCEKDGVDDCCPLWSLPNYISGYLNKTDCAQLRPEDIKVFEQDLQTCTEFYRDETLSTTEEKVPECARYESTICPRKCFHGNILHNTYSITLDNNFLLKNESRYTMMVLPLGKSSNDQHITEYLQQELPEIVLPKDYVSLAGYDFGGKDNTFRSFLVSDLQYMVAASLMIFVIVCSYTKSVLVSIISFSILTLSMGNAYFFYCAVFQVPYFPFMNMLVTIIVMGIGTDGTLIFGSQWHRLKKKHASQRSEKEYWHLMMADLLSETTAPLFITTCTTAAAFYASLTSSITTIRCFSIFAGTATLLGFFLLYLSVPPALVISDLIAGYLLSLLPEESETSSKLYSKGLQLYHRFHDLQRASFKVFIRPCQCVRNVIENNRAKCWLMVFLTLVSVLMWSIFVVFVHPQFELPKTEQFQLLSNSHPIERFDRVIEPEFTSGGLSEEELADKLTVYFIWGLEASDSGDPLDPTDNGVLQFDQTFSLQQPASQKWIRNLCAELKIQSFYDEVANSMVGANYDSCFIETMENWMKRDCDHIFFKNISYSPCCKVSKFPYEEKVFNKCVGLASRDMHRTPSHYFRSDIAGPKFFVLTETGPKTEQNDSSTRLNAKSSEIVTMKSPTHGGNLATFTLRVKTNVSFSLRYEKMDKFYKELDSFFNDYLQSEPAPLGLEHGFFVSAHLDFYDLQKSLLDDTRQSLLLSALFCFLFLWIFSKDLGVAIGAVVCIFSIVIVSSAVLISCFSWKLGVFESIAVTVAVGLSDFTAHNAIEFSKRKSVAEMTSPTFFAAVTTITMGLMMLIFSNVLVYQQIGAFFFVLIVVSWVYSVFFLSPVLAFFDFISTAVRLRRVPKPPSSIFTTGVSYSSPVVSQISNQNSPVPIEGTVYCNTMLGVNKRSNRTSLRRNRAISEPAIQNMRNSIHFGRTDSTELVECPIRRATRARSSQNMMMEQLKLLKKLGTETAV